MKCEICKKEAKSRYCDHHQKAYENVVENFGSWRKALEISWEDYLKEIIKNPLTGKWAKEVAEHLIKTGEKAPCQEK